LSNDTVEGSSAEAVDDAMQDIQGYQLGQDFVIGNAVPYIGQFAMEIPVESNLL
jgi:hypothetical protein